MNISLIVACDKNRLIGADNEMPWHLPADFKHFKEVTMGKPILMGRKTFESIGRPLPGRLNVVISRKGFTADGVTTVDSIDSALSLVSDAEEVMVIGGANIYEQMIGQANKMYITHVDAECEGDAWFPEFDLNNWKLENEESKKVDEKNNYNFRIATYVKK